MENQRLSELLDNPFPYLKEGGPPDLCKFKNTCVIDSLLAALHTSYLKYSKIKDVLHTDVVLGDIMSLLTEKKYIEARNICMTKLNIKKFNLYGNIKDFFPLIDELIYMEIPYKEAVPVGHEIYNIPSILTCGDLKVLGGSLEADLILVHRDVHNDLYRDCTDLPPSFNDGNGRSYGLQFILLGKNEHMTMCFQSAEEKWIHYDNDPKRQSFQPFDFRSLRDYAICLAGYVNITPAQELKFGIAETGTGAKPFNLSSGNEQTDQETGVSIQETGAGIGVQLIQGEDEEMLTCSSSDEMMSCSSSSSDEM